MEQDTNIAGSTGPAAKEPREFEHLSSLTYGQKKIIDVLFAGGTIAYNGTGAIRLRDKNFNPVQKINEKSFRKIKKLLRKNNRRLYVYSVGAVRKLHGSSWVKKRYKQLLKTKKQQNAKS